MPPLIDITGHRFGRLVVIGRDQKQPHWNCRCDCGEIARCSTGNLKSGNSKSCGCLSAEVSKRKDNKFRKHNKTKTPEYNNWVRMRQRCLVENNVNFPSWGGRGITICERWNDFENFLADMGTRPTPKHSIDRIDNNGNYEPINCRWATMKEQSRNRRSNHFVTVNGVTKTIVEWAEISGLHQSTIFKRLAKYGWPPDQAVSRPPNKANRVI